MKFYAEFGSMEIIDSEGNYRTFETQEDKEALLHLIKSHFPMSEVNAYREKDLEQLIANLSEPKEGEAFPIFELEYTGDENEIGIVEGEYQPMVLLPFHACRVMNASFDDYLGNHMQLGEIDLKGVALPVLLADELKEKTEVDTTTTPVAPLAPAIEPSSSSSSSSSLATPAKTVPVAIPVASPASATATSSSSSPLVTVQGTGETILAKFLGLVSKLFPRKTSQNKKAEASPVIPSQAPVESKELMAELSQKLGEPASRLETSANTTQAVVLKFERTSKMEQAESNAADPSPILESSAADLSPKTDQKPQSKLSI